MKFLGMEVSKSTPPIIVAEISCNHQGSIENAINLIKAAKDATADAVKIQVYTADDMTACTDLPDFWIKDGPWAGKNLYDLYKETATPYEFVKPLFEFAKLIDIPIFASVFSKRGVDHLESLGCGAYKIASFEIVDQELIKYAVSTGKSIILSTGMASSVEIDQAFELCDPTNTILMHCISAYPTQVHETNLQRLKDFRNLFTSLIGFSDHTIGTQAAPLAVALGARMIEKHLALDTSQGAQDEHFSALPVSFKLMAEACRRAFQATQPCDVPGEASSRQFRRSLYAVTDVVRGQKFTSGNVRSIRPSYGLHSSRYLEVTHEKKAACDIKVGTALKEEHLK